MGAFLSLLGGLSKGAGDAYSEIDKQRREEKAKQNALIASSLYKEMTTNEELTREDQHHLLGKYLEHSGVTDKKVIKGIQDAYGYHRKALEDQERQARPAPALEAPQLTTPEGVQMPPTAGLPSLPPPPYQAKSVGQLKFEESRGRERQGYDDKAEAAREAARRALRGSLEDKIAIFHEVEGTSMEDEVRYMLGMAPRTALSGVESRNLPGNGMRGKDVIELFRRFGKPTEGLDEKKLYNVTVSRDGRTPIGAFPKEESAIGSGKETTGAQLLAMGITKDGGRADVVAGGTYNVLHSGQGGGVLTAIPTTQFQSYIEKNNIQVVTDGDGNIHAVPVKENSTTTKTPTAVPPGAATLPPMPQAPGGLSTPDTALGTGGTPRPAAAPAAKTAPTARTAPAASAGGGGTGTIIGARPTQIPEGTVEKMTAVQNTINQSKRLQELLPNVQGHIGPVSGRVTDFALENLGGFDPTHMKDLPPDVVEFSSILKELIANKALERGGRTLPAIEQKIYTSQLPKATDRGSVLSKKLKVFLPLFEKDLQNQLKGLTGNQRAQMTGTTDAQVGAPVPTRPTPGRPVPKIGEIIKSGPHKGLKVTAIENGEAVLE